MSRKIEPGMHVFYRLPSFDYPDINYKVCRGQVLTLSAGSDIAFIRSDSGTLLQRGVEHLTEQEQVLPWVPS